MILRFKQRFFSLLDSYDVTDEEGRAVYSIKSSLAIGHSFRVFDSRDIEVGWVKQQLLTLTPTFEIWIMGRCCGRIRRQFFSWFRPRYEIDFMGWQVEGSLFELDYSILDEYGRELARVTKELFHLTDTYNMEIFRPEDALPVLMFVLAVDAEKCSRKN